jgi:hypothetical protein
MAIYIAASRAVHFDVDQSVDCEPVVGIMSRAIKGRGHFLPT